MEAIVVIILFLFGGWILRALIAGGKSAVTGQSFQESYRGIADWTTKLENETFRGDNNTSFDFKAIKAKGLIPIAYSTSLSRSSNGENRLLVMCLLKHLLIYQ